MHAGGLSTNKDMGGLLQQNGRDMLTYHAGRLQIAVFPVWHVKHAWTGLRQAALLKVLLAGMTQQLCKAEVGHTSTSHPKGPRGQPSSTRQAK